ncbi:hypothetical protein Y032_0105g3717 [Ancylostoma ceylanicum]|uniref:Peptidase M13 C-terminal domain-containing protein n=1 Tax=Ancylostoma ceylanicum TaxID=53326 RepID=A0A016TGB5_9BILA|nr:hypothetical protein Y032_0105g3717 [Ancylostoma ceylanicum]
MGAKIDSPDKAFATSYKKHGAEPRLSGLEEFTNHQLFFIGFASTEQVLENNAVPSVSFHCGMKPLIQLVEDLEILSQRIPYFLGAFDVFLKFKVHLCAQQHEYVQTM